MRGGCAAAQTLRDSQRVDDPYTDHNRAYLFVKEARFRANGNYQDFTFNAELALGAEAAIAATKGVSLALLDLSVNVPLRFVNRSRTSRSASSRCPMAASG